MAARATVVVFALVLAMTGGASAQLSTGFYSYSCPSMLDAVRSALRPAIAREQRVGASIVRLFFHDCFVQGCDASLLLDDAPGIQGEKNATPNKNSARGFEVIDAVKAAVEKACPGVVSCADVLAVAAEESVVALGGPSWEVKVGRRDSTTASFNGANNDIPPPTSGLANLTSLFAAKGLSQKDMVALSGAHTIVLARCTNFRGHIYNDTNIDASFAKSRQSNCPRTTGSGDNNLAPLDLQTPTVFENAYYKNLVQKRALLHSDQELFNGGAADAQVREYVGSRQSNCPRTTGSGDNNLAPLDLQTPTVFENAYYKNLVQKRALLHSDQELFNGGAADAQVREYVGSQEAFFKDFVAGMIKMGDVAPLTGSNGQIRKNCRRIN